MYSRRRRERKCATDDGGCAEAEESEFGVKVVAQVLAAVVVAHRFQRPEARAVLRRVQPDTFGRSSGQQRTLLR